MRPHIAARITDMSCQIRQEDTGHAGSWCLLRCGRCVGTVDRSRPL
ncbi:MAG: hypothetical protein OXB92_11565 [Acidimicrobiaceae bacterium]|nr:hypothetical protein [Acidimicrobiaceae bacterium]